MFCARVGHDPNPGDVVVGPAIDGVGVHEFRLLGAMRALNRPPGQAETAGTANVTGTWPRL